MDKYDKDYNKEKHIYLTNALKIDNPKDLFQYI